MPPRGCRRVDSGDRPRPYCRRPALVASGAGLAAWVGMHLRGLLLHGPRLGPRRDLRLGWLEGGQTLLVVIRRYLLFCGWLGHRLRERLVQWVGQGDRLGQGHGLRVTHPHPRCICIACSPAAGAGLVASKCANPGYLGGVGGLGALGVLPQCYPGAGRLGWAPAAGHLSEYCQLRRRSRIPGRWVIACRSQCNRQPRP